jgi:ArsR family transcriptional regulator, arsenate/arsenite/antimonite-responsive transcriptional repressor
MVKKTDFDMELFFKALADKTRLRLISLMGEEEICVCFFQEVINTTQTKISRHLAYLRKAGLVEARREGKWMHYRVIEPQDEHAAKAFREIREWLKQDAQMQRDSAKLVQVCCSPSLPVQLQRAPRPAALVG